MQGAQLHIARWDYNTTGGAPGDAQINKLSNKRVAIVSVGAAAIQPVPRLTPICKASLRRAANIISGGKEKTATYQSCSIQKMMSPESPAGS